MVWKSAGRLHIYIAQQSADKTLRGCWWVVMSTWPWLTFVPVVSADTANFCVKDEHRHPYCASHAALFRTPWLKAIDFGCSQMHFRNTRLTKRSGTPVYMAPEVFRRDYSFEVDVWSTGVTLYQLFSRRFPFWDGDSYSRALSLDEVAKAITEVR